jgi:hypothetical protein
LLTASLAAGALSTHQYPRAQSPPAAARPTSPVAGDDNPRIAPGLVRWHASFAKARQAARRSGKPVLLFHLMGQLDRQFC